MHRRFAMLGGTYTHPDGSIELDFEAAAGVDHHLDRQEVREVKVGWEAMKDAKRSRAAGAMMVRLAIPLDEFINCAMNQLRDQDNRDRHRSAITRISEFLSDGNNVFLRSPLPFQNGFSYLKDFTHRDLSDILHQNEWSILFFALTASSGGGLSDWIETILTLFRRQETGLPTVRLIPAKRSVGAPGSGFGDYSGRGLIEKLATAQNPTLEARNDRKIFDRINKFLRSVTGVESAEIEIPHDRQHILVHMNGRILPLESLGTGISEVIMIASFCTLTMSEISFPLSH